MERQQKQIYLLHMGHKKTNLAKSPEKNFDPLRKEKKESLESANLGCKACDIIKMTSSWSHQV